MDCPVCKDTQLTMADRQGIEIDYCPKCRGIWLDRGELDKLIERSSAPVGTKQYDPAPKQHYREERPYQGERSERYHKHDDDYHDQRYPNKKRKSFLGELFDFD